MAVPAHPDPSLAPSGESPFTKQQESHHDIDSELASSNFPPAYDKKDDFAAGQADPFGSEETAEIKYKTVEWWQAAMLMIAETVSLGILSLPSALATLGLVPGIILILGLGVLSTYTGYVMYQFRNKYPHVHNMADAGEVLAGRFGRYFGAVSQQVYIVFVMASHVLTFTIAFNVMTKHATCTIVWGIAGTIMFWLLTLPRKLEDISWLSIPSFISITAAVLITMIALGVHPADDATVHPTVEVALAPAFLAVSNIVFAYSGNVAFFSFIAELREPKDFPKALFSLQIFDTCLYLIAAVVIYRYAGTDVASPALGSTSPLVMKIAYGIALPTITIAGVVYGNVAAKFFYIRLFHNSDTMHSRGLLARGSWALLTLGLWLVAWVLAESIPGFNNLLGLISSIFGSWFTYGTSAFLWLYINQGRWFQNWKKIGLTMLNFSLILIAATIMVLGLYASGKSIHDDEGQGGSWSCADNSLRS